jgi:hypothetical protein
LLFNNTLNHAKCQSRLYVVTRLKRKSSYNITQLKQVLTNLIFHPPMAKVANRFETKLTFMVSSKKNHALYLKNRNTQSTDSYFKVQATIITTLTQGGCELGAAQIMYNIERIEKNPASRLNILQRLVPVGQKQMLSLHLLSAAFFCFHCREKPWACDIFNLH